MRWSCKYSCFLLTVFLLAASCTRSDDGRRLENAVTYYWFFGTPSQKLQSLSSLGLYRFEQKDYGAALAAYQRAENIPANRVSEQDLASLYLHEAWLYSRLSAYDLSLSKAGQCAKLAAQCNNDKVHFQATICQADTYLKRGLGAECDSCLVIASGLVSDIKSDLPEIQYLKQLQMGRAAHGYLHNGLPEQALELLQALEEEYRLCSTDPYYCFLIVQALFGTNDYQRGYRAARQYLHLSQSLNLESYLAQVDIVDERESFRRRNGWLWNTLFIIIVLTLAIAVVMSSEFRKQVRREQNLKDVYEHLRAEYEQIKNLPMLVSGLPPDSQETLIDRIRAMGRFFSNPYPESLDLVADQLESLSQNRKELLESIGILYAVYHPAFVSKLLDSRLTTLEVGYCCLLVAGLRTGEIKDVINKSAVYNINVAIRKKLEIDANASTLSAFLKNLYAQTES